MKRALVTGVSRGIGLSISRKLLLDGYSVTGTHFKSPIPDELKNSEHFRSVRVNFENLADLQRVLFPLFQESVFDTLVNNTGIVEEASFSFIDDEWNQIWDRTFQVNLKSAAFLSKWFINKTVSDSREGKIINISSRAAFRGDTQEYAIYAASKAGLAALTKSIARDFSRKGITAFTVAPGYIATDMAKASAELLGIDILTKGSAFDEITSPEQVANIVAFLAKGETSHMSGSTLHINGGSYML